MESTDNYGSIEQQKRESSISCCSKFINYSSNYILPIFILIISLISIVIIVILYIAKGKSTSIDQKVLLETGFIISLILGISSFLIAIIYIMLFIFNKCYNNKKDFLLPTP